MEKKRCSGYKGVWACAEDYPDHMVPVENFGHHYDGFQPMCRNCQQLEKPVSNAKRPRHPETNQLKVNWVEKRAKGYYGGEPANRKTDDHWKACRAKAEQDSSDIDWVYPDAGSNVVPLPLIRHDEPAGKPMRTREGGALQGELVPQGFVYVVQNPDLPHILKIGKTYPDGIGSIMSNARRFGRAVLVEKYYFDEALEAEKAIHGKLVKWNMRVLGYEDCGKELFKCSVNCFRKALCEYHQELIDEASVG